ncbi:unnamed protein product [Phyllotreta striolata]|uniref:Uncharacterized protein n=1 Tax=Phyllotreta striolata TaxID=444603 RepID=A0A9N9XRW3_PHYSR|nr:unnamed protein product [Phyllotreta striolata]
MGKPKKWPAINYRYVPTIKKAKKKLGPFWFLLYDTCVCEPCECMEKIERAIKGDTWESPSDTLQGKVIMHPPYTRKYIQASVHRKILEIGSEVEQKLRQEYEVDKQLALEQQEKGLSKEFHESILERLKDAEAVEKTACFRELQAQAEEFENTLVCDNRSIYLLYVLSNQQVDQIDELEGKMKVAFDEFSSAHQKELDEKLQEKLSLAAESTAKTLTKRLLSELVIQKSIYQKYFDTKIKKKELEIDYNKSKHINQLAQHLKIEKQRIECTNIANMIYVLVMERRKCANELETIKERFASLKTQLNRKVAIQMETIKRLEKDLQNNMKQVFVRERCYKEILKQYQKFINYALKACPTQAQFLLSLERLMSFELAEILPQEKNPNYHGMPRLCDTILPWVHAGQEGKRRRNVAGLELDDHHDCFNELAIPKVPGETEFPSFYYKNKLYVREDFRNLISQGIVLTPSHDMWSEDLEILMGILKDFSSEKTIYDKLEEADLTEKSADTHADLVQTKPILAPLTPKDKQMISEYVQAGPLVENPPYMIAVRNSLEFLQKRRGAREAAALPDIAEAAKEEDEEKEESGEDDKPRKEPSLEEKIEKELKVDVPSDTGTDMKKLKQSEIEFRTSLSLESVVVEDQRQSVASAKPPEPPKKSEEQRKRLEVRTDPNLPAMPPRTCKLATSRDSVAYLRESRQALLKPAPINVGAKREERRFPSLTPATEYCCEKCLKKRGLVLRPLDVKVVKGEREKAKAGAEPAAKASIVLETADEKLAAEFYPNKLIDLYKEQNLRTKSRKSEVKKKAKTSKLVVDDSKGEDVVVFDNDYTIKRMRSFISSISEKPQLIKLFTACQR